MKIPVLMYHSISDDNNKSSLNKFKFEKQMSFMKKMGFETTDLDDFTSKKKKFVITFDDGYEDVYKNALPILKKYNFQAICFFVTNYIGKTNLWDSKLDNYQEMKLMNKEQIYNWAQSGMLIGSHTNDHLDLKSISDNEKHYQISSPLKYFKENFDIDIKYFSYPFGSYDLKSLEISQNFYKYSFTTKRSRFNSDLHTRNAIPRVPVNKKDNLFKFFIKTHTFYEDIKYQ